MTNRLKKWGKAVVRPFSTPQLVSLGAIAIVIFILGDGSLPNLIRNKMEIHNLQKQIEHYKSETEKNRTKLQEITSNKNDVEKFARENYLMRKPGEDVYIVN